eukprot:2889921-Rhodomonas_salina.1
MGILSKGVHKSYEIGKTIGKYVHHSRPARLRCLRQPVSGCTLVSCILFDFVPGGRNKPAALCHR